MISRKRLLAAVALAAFCSSVCPGISLAAEPGKLGEARNHYEFAEFNQALDICNQLITGGSLTGDDLRDVYVLKARCLVNVGNHSMAQESFCSALKQDKSWRPAPDLLTKDEQADFDLALAGCVLETAPAPVKPAPAKPAPAISPAATAPATAPAPAEGKPWYKKPVFWVLGAAAIGGAVALAGGGSKGGGGSSPTGPLPGFPNPPSGR